MSVERTLAMVNTYPDSLIEFPVGALREADFELDESATYTFGIKNVSSFVNITFRVDTITILNENKEDVTQQFLDITVDPPSGSLGPRGDSTKINVTMRSTMQTGIGVHFLRPHVIWTGEITQTTAEPPETDQLSFEVSNPLGPKA